MRASIAPQARIVVAHTVFQPGPARRSCVTSRQAAALESENPKKWVPSKAGGAKDQHAGAMITADDEVCFSSSSGSFPESRRASQTTVRVFPFPGFPVPAASPWLPDCPGANHAWGWERGTCQTWDENEMSLEDAHRRITMRQPRRLLCRRPAVRTSR